MTEIDAGRERGRSTRRKKAAYEALRRSGYMDTPDVRAADVPFWQDTLQDGRRPPSSTPRRRSPRSSSVENRPYIDLFTATSGTCPTFDRRRGTFTAGGVREQRRRRPACSPTPACMTHFFGNLAFRRVRWVQETFAARSSRPRSRRRRRDVGGASPYTGVWPFDQHRRHGERRPRQLPRHVVGHLRELPLDDEPHRAAVRELRRERRRTSRRSRCRRRSTARRSRRCTDYLPAGETTAWRFGVPAARHPGARRGDGRRPRRREVRRRAHVELGARQDGHRRHAAGGSRRDHPDASSTASPQAASSCRPGHLRALRGDHDAGLAGPDQRERPVRRLLRGCLERRLEGLFRHRRAAGQRRHRQLLDVYERSGGTTTLVSQGQINGNGAVQAGFAGASGDGSRGLLPH